VDGYDGRSQAEKDLAAINAEISARATGGFVAEYAIGDRSLKREPTCGASRLKSRYEGIVARERAGAEHRERARHSAPRPGALPMKLDLRAAREPRALDRPRRACRRARAAQAHVRGRANRASRRDWIASGTSADAEIMTSLRALRDRARAAGA
jgi:hypothetical protein